MGDSSALLRDCAVGLDAGPGSYTIGEMPLVAPLGHASAGYYRAKRILDFGVASLLLIVLLPLLPLVAAAILIDSGRPVFYSQPRVRSRRIRNGSEWRWRLETFAFYKFRTMHRGTASASHEEYMAAYISGDEEKLVELGGSEAAEAGTYKLLGDPRVTRVGRVLRSLSIDELPQLVNVLRGDMSLVGPRPPIPYEVAMYRPTDMDRFATPPGITGAWQVGGRSDLTFDDMIALDVDYIRNQSLALDLRMLLKTVPAVCTRKGAG